MRLGIRCITAIRHVFVATCALVIASNSWAGPREQAKRMHDRLTGVPPTTVVLDSMEQKIAAGDANGAAFEAMENAAFYNTTVRQFAAPWTNRDQSVFVNLNDTIATAIGVVRDNVPFDQILSNDLVYVGTDAATNIAYATDNNDHYLDMEEANVDLSDPLNLEARTQSGLSAALDTQQTAGILTTRGYAQAFLVAGTNRAAVRFATLNFMCLDMEDMRDISAWPDRIRQDVTRSPGGDSAIFLNDCLSCHAGLDALAGAFAYYDFNEESAQLEYTAAQVQEKYRRDSSVFPFGFETLGDSWINYWRSGPNSHVGWRGPGSGMGAKSFGQEIAQTERFDQCQTSKVFERVCYRTPNGEADQQALTAMVTNFQASNRNLKQVFADAATYCMGE